MIYLSYPFIQDVVLRSAAVEGMGLYRSLLVTAESDATVRAERYRRFKFRKEAIRNVKESIIKECLMRGLETRQPTDGNGYRDKICIVKLWDVEQIVLCSVVCIYQTTDIQSPKLSSHLS